MRSKPTPLNARTVPKTLAANYCREVGQQLRYLATWLPQTPIAIGDIGELRDGVFEKVGSLRDRGIAFETQRTIAQARIRYVSETGVSMYYKAAGHTPPLGCSLQQNEAGCVVRFSKANAIFFEATGCAMTSIAGLRSLYARVLSDFMAGEWNARQFVVTEVVEATAATILIGGSTGGTVELFGSAELSSGSSLANATLGLGTRRSDGMATEIVAVASLTPLFRACGVRRKLWGNPAIEHKNVGGVGSGASEWTVSELDYDEIAV